MLEMTKRLAPQLYNPSLSQRGLVRGGLIAGAIAALAAGLVSLPLRSPLDSLFNSGSVAMAGLAAGLTAGVVWRLLANATHRSVLFAISWALAFVAVALVSVIGETQLERLVAFVLPLAAIILLLTGVLTPPMAGSSMLRRWWLAPALALLALGVGLALAGQGDQESGRLELPPRSSTLETVSGPSSLETALLRRP